MFDRERFVDDCRTAIASDPSHKTVQDVVARAMADPPSVLKGLGEPTRAGIDKIHVNESLTIINVVWGPYLTIMPHNHRMWAVIGIYGGREDNIFWRRLPDDAGGRIEAAGARALAAKDAIPLGRDIIHSVTNPIPRLTGAIHVYGGDFFGVARSEWDPETLVEAPYSVEKTLQIFEESNRAIAAAGA